jgi:twinkle protein
MTAKVLSTLDLTRKLIDLYETGLPKGDSTGWPSLDRYYSVVPGQLTVVTGWPSSGKSEWLDALMVNLSRQGWRFAIYSPENRPEETHLAKLIEKRSGKPFGPGPTPRIDSAELKTQALDISLCFKLIGTDDGEPPTMPEILAVAEQALQGQGKHGLIVDPWNELDHLRPAALSETEYVSRTLSTVRGWARTNNVHVWIMAHPRNVKRDDGGKLPVPRPDMISGSQHWWNKADNAITVWRDMEQPDSQDVEIHVQKVRFKHIGRPGLADLKWDRVTGRYHEPSVYSSTRAVR